MRIEIRVDVDPFNATVEARLKDRDEVFIGKAARHWAVPNYVGEEDLKSRSEFTDLKREAIEDLWGDVYLASRRGGVASALLFMRDVRPNEIAVVEAG